MRHHPAENKGPLEKKVSQLTDILLKQMEVNSKQTEINESHQRSIEKLEKILNTMLMIEKENK